MISNVEEGTGGRIGGGGLPVVYSERSIWGGRNFGMQDTTYFKGNISGNAVFFARPPVR